MALPVATAVTTPVEEPMVATVVVLLLHVPPVAVLVSVAVPAGQSVVVPEMVPAVGRLFTITVAVALDVPQLLVTVYITDVLPVATPVITPVEETVTTDVLPLVQLPPVGVPVNVADAEGHTVLAPDIEAVEGAAVTVTTCVATTVPHVLETI